MYSSSLIQMFSIPSYGFAPDLWDSNPELLRTFSSPKEIWEALKTVNARLSIRFPVFELKFLSSRCLRSQLQADGRAVWHPFDSVAPSSFYSMSLLYVPLYEYLSSSIGIPSSIHQKAFLFDLSKRFSFLQQKMLSTAQSGGADTYTFEQCGLILDNICESMLDPQIATSLILYLWQLYQTFAPTCPPYSLESGKQGQVLSSIHPQILLTRIKDAIERLFSSVSLDSRLLTELLDVEPIAEEVWNAFAKSDPTDTDLNRVRCREDRFAAKAESLWIELREPNLLIRKFRHTIGVLGIAGKELPVVSADTTTSILQSFVEEFALTAKLPVTLEAKTAKLQLS